MGQKVHPRAFRLGITSTWDSKWFARGRRYAELLRQDVEVRAYLKRKFRDASLASVEIERGANTVTVTLATGKPGVIIGRGGSGVDELRKDLERRFFKVKGVKLSLSIKEVDHPQRNAQIVAIALAQEIERRMPFRRTMKRAIEQVMKAGALGVKIQLGGRLGGAEIARDETLSQGKIPMHTLRANIEFGRTVAMTTYGTVGVKVWVNHGEVFSKVGEGQKLKTQSER
jgi:small subunit ribosomal protein S3